MPFDKRTTRFANLSVRAASCGLSLLALSSIARAQEPVPPAGSNEAKPAAQPATPTPPPPPITLNAQLEANYTVNFNRPFNGSNLYLYNTKEGQFALNLAEVKVSRAATDASRVGFNVRLIEGEIRTTRNFNAGEYGGLPNVLEAYGTFLVPAKGRDLKVDVGQFVTHVGYETIDIGTNNFFSRNFLFQFPSPFYNAGVRAAYPFSGKFSASGFILNRYNGINDTGNRDLAPGFQLALTPSGTQSLILNGLYSRENLAYDGTQQPGVATVKDRQNGKPLSILDLIYSNQFNPGFKLVVEGLYRWGKYDEITNVDEEAITTDSRSYNLGGAAGYLIFPFKNGNVAAIRGEYMQQSRTNAGVIPLGATTNGHPNIGSITASYELHAGIFPGLRTLLEYRYDYSNNSVFGGRSDNEFKKSQNTLTIGQVYAF